MRTLSGEEGGDGGFCFIAWKRRNVICSEMHAVAVVADLPFHRSDTKLRPAGEFVLTLCLMRLARLPAAADRRPAAIAAWRAMMLALYVGFGEISIVYFE